jgi:hypothetical protein
MPFDPLTWAIGFAAGKAATKFLDKLVGLASKDDLTRELELSFESWARELPESAAVEPQTLATVLFSESQAEPGPAGVALGTKLKEHELPSEETWLAALTERWLEVASRGGDLQEFFLLAPAEATDHLKKLASAIHRVCRTDPKLFQNAVVESLQHLTALLESISKLLERQTPSVEDIEERMLAFSRVLLRYPTTLSARGEQIPRPEFDALMNRIRDSRWSSTVVIGERGSGKSALLAKLADSVRNRGWALLAIKADLLQSGTSQTLVQVAGEVTIEDAILAIARTKKIVVIIDQVDAIAELLDRTTDRLNVVLNLVHRIAQFHNVHVVLSSREFEYRTDARLTSLDFEELRLELPPWSDIAPLLSSREHDPNTMSDVLRGLLRNPWTLKIFIGIAKHGEFFSSLSALLDRVWISEVVAGLHGREKVALLNSIVKWMIDNEDFVVPTSIADTEPAALSDLLSSAILVRDGGTLTFRHQTFFEFTTARRFGSGNADFLQHVVERQDGLFVRPTIVTTLVLLRDTAPREYARIAAALLAKPDIRLHVKILVVDFIASQREPLESERELLPPCFGDEHFGRRILDVMDPRGWHRSLLECEHFRDWLRNVDGAVRCLPLLTRWVSDTSLRRDVLRLIADEWIQNREFDPLLDQLLRAISCPDPVSAEMMDLLLVRSGLHGALDGLADGRRTAEAVAYDIEARLAEFEDESAVAPSAARESLAMFLRDYPIAMISSAELQPDKYLAIFWPIVVRCLTAIGNQPCEPPLIIHADEVRRTTKSRAGIYLPDWYPIVRPVWTRSPVRWSSRVLDAVAYAIGLVAQRSPDDFLEFLQREGESDVEAVHLLMDGALRQMAFGKPQHILHYLIADTGRLRVHVSDGRRPSIAAILLDRLDDDERANLEATIAALDPPLDYDVTPVKIAAPTSLIAPFLPKASAAKLVFVTPEMTKAEKKKEKGQGKAKAKGFQESQKAATTQSQTSLTSDALMVQIKEVVETMNLLDPQKAATPSLSLTSLTDDALMLQINEELAILEQAADAPDAAETIPFDDIGDKLGKELFRDPGRVLRLLQKMTERHENVVDALIMCLPRTLPVDDLIDTIVSLDQRGFKSFRGAAAWQLCRRRDRDLRIPDAMAYMLLRWMEETPPELPNMANNDASPPKSATTSQSKSAPFEPLVAGQYFLGKFQPRTSIFVALSEALLRRRVPLVTTWRDAVTREITREANLDFWQYVLQDLAEIYRCDPRIGDEVLVSIVDNHPALLELPMTIWHFGRFFAHIDRHLAREIIARLRVLDVSPTKQGAFELLLSRDDLDESDFREVRQASESGDPSTLAGAGYGAVYVWRTPQWRMIAVELLQRVASAGDPIFDDVLQRFLVDRQRDRTIGKDTQEVLEAIVAHAALTRDTTAALLDLLQMHTVECPDLVHRLTLALIERIGTDFDDASRPFFVYAGAITSIAITLHRQPPFRVLGLALFERLLECDAREAHAAIEMLDRRPGVRHTSVNWRRSVRPERDAARAAQRSADA